MKKTLIGTIVKPQGIRGEVKVRCETAELADVLDAAEFYIDGGAPVKSVSAAVRGGFAFIKLSGVNTRNDAEALRGKQLFAEERLVKLKKGEYFVKDIIGCRLVDTGGTLLGVITAIDNFGAADVYTAETADGRVFRFPFIKALKAKVDTVNQTMAVDPQVFSEVSIFEGAE